MRGAIVAVMLLPLFSGCLLLDEAETKAPTLERFTATYAILKDSWHGPHEQVVTFGQVVSYMDMDGMIRKGYLVDVDTTHPESSGRPQSILASDLSLARTRWCNGWSGRVCTNDQYDWTGSGPAWHEFARFGVASILHAPNVTRTEEGAAVVKTDGGGRYEFGDGRLAPTRILHPDGPYAVRTSYRALGPLEPIPPRVLQPPEAAAMDPRSWPGLKEPVAGYPVTLGQALDHLTAQSPKAKELLQGGCLSYLRIFRSQQSPYSGPGLPILLDDKDVLRFDFGLVNGKQRGGFFVTWGHKAPLGELGFLRAQESTTAPGDDCASLPGQTITLEQAASLAGLVVKGRYLFATAQSYDQEGVPTLTYHFTFQGARSSSVQIMGGPGTLYHVWVPKDQSIGL